MSRDSHHVLFTRRDWESRLPGSKLRSTSSLIVDMPRELHNDIHRACPAVPVPNYHALARVASRLVVSRDPLETMDNLLFATEEALRHPRTHDLERSLGYLMMEAVELQRPFIREAMGGIR